MQTSYSLESGIGYPGQVNEIAPSEIVSYTASETILPGTFVELDTTNGTIKNPQATTLGKIVGLACYASTWPPGGYAAGDTVPVLRKGRALASFNGGTDTYFGAVNIKHASDDTLSNAQYRGYATASATSATAGAEVDAAPTSIVFVKPCTPSTMAYIELNMP
jgi:hypothetical protein